MWRKIFSFIITLSLVFQQIGFAGMATELNLAGHLAKMSSAFTPDRFRPVHMRFFAYDSLNDNIKVMLDKGDLKKIKQSELNQSSQELLNYFLVGVNLPNEVFWVNLRPDSEDEIIDSSLARTDVGKIMLEADLQLKKDTAKFTSPETSEGREYWNRLYKKAEELYGYQEVTIPTLTRPWIVPNGIIVRQDKNSAYIYKASLKVMLEQDFLKDSTMYNFKDERSKALNEYSSELIRELIIPKLTQEVNLSKRYAPLRQVYYSIILSRWFKSKFAHQAGKYASRIDKKDLSGLVSATAWSKATYFEAYKKSFAQGEYNVKETVRTPTGQVIRTYFSGGLNLRQIPVNGTQTISSPITSALMNAGLVAPEGMEVTSSPLVSKSNSELFASIPQAVQALANRDLTRVNVLIRVNVNVPAKEHAIADATRLKKIKQIGDFIISKGGTPIFFGHNGSLDKKTGKDSRQNLVDVAGWMKENIFSDLVFHEKTIINEKQEVQISWGDIIQGVPNLLQNVRLEDSYEVGAKRMIYAKALAQMSGSKDGKNKILIVDAFGDIGSDGTSVGLIPFLMQEVYTGPEMVAEFIDLEQEVREGFDGVLFGGIKVAKLASLEGLNRALNPGGFIFIPSGLTPALKNMPAFMEKLAGGDAQRVLLTIDNSDETTNDIGPKTLEMILAKLDAFKAGQRLFVNGTMGNMEEKSGKYKVGTERVWAKLKELAQRGVKIIIVGGDSGSTTVKYKLDKEPNVKTYSGGGVAFSYIADENLVGLRALARKQMQLELEKKMIAETAQAKYNVAINGARGRMGLLYLHSLLYNEKFADMRVAALNGIPIKDLDAFIEKLKRPDSTYGRLFPGIEIKVLDKYEDKNNEDNSYAIIEVKSSNQIEGQPILILNNRKGSIRWDKVGDFLGEEYLTGLGIIETSGQNLGSAESQKAHLTNAGDATVVFGAPSKDKGTPTVVLSVNEEVFDIDTQILSNASCTTNAIAPPAAKIHKRYGVKRGIIKTIHAKTSDQAAYDTFRGDEAARGRQGDRLQSPAKTGAAALLGKLIDGIGPNDGKAMRVGTMTGSVVVYTAELERPATAEELRDMFIQANKDESDIFGIGYNLASKDIIKDPHSTIVDLDSIQVSEDGLTIKIAFWYDNEWGYAQRGLDTLKRAMVAQEEGTKTKDFEDPTPAVKAEKEVKVLPASEIAGLKVKGALPMFIPVKKTATGKEIPLYLTGTKEKHILRYMQIILRTLMGDERFNIEAIVVDGVTTKNFSAAMKAFAQSVQVSTDLGNLAAEYEITPMLFDNGEMYLRFQVGDKDNARDVRVLANLPENLDSGVKVIDVNKIKYSFAEMIDKVTGSLKPLNAKLLSAIISMSNRPGGELLDSGTGPAVSVNILPIKLGELDKRGILYQAYEVPVMSGSYLFITFSIKGMVEKDIVHKLLKTIPGLGMLDTTSSNFVANRSNIILDKSQTLIIQDKKGDVTDVGLFFLVNEELNAADRVLEGIAASSAIQAEQADPGMTVPAERPFEITAEEEAAYVNEIKNDFYQYTGFDQVGKVIPAVGLIIANKGNAGVSQEYQDALRYSRNLIGNYNKGLIGMYLRTALIFGNDQNKEQYIDEAREIASSNDVPMRERLIAKILLIAIGDKTGAGHLAEIDAMINQYSLRTDEGILARIGSAMSSKDLHGYVTMLKEAMSGMVNADSRRMEVLVGLIAIANRDSLISSSPVKTGGIDFRPGAMMINYQPVGNFSGLKLDLPKFSPAELATFDVNKELEGIEKIVAGQMIPSGERIKEVLVASSQRGELDANRERLMALLVKVGILEETISYLDEAGQGYKEALVLVDTLS